MAIGPSPGQVDGPLIELRALAVSFGGLSVLRGIDLEIRGGEALGMVGESGSGKSITWLAALGLLPRSACVTGEARIASKNPIAGKSPIASKNPIASKDSAGSKNLIGASEQDLAAVRGGRIGLVFQDPVSALNPVQRVGDQVCEALRLHRGLSGAGATAQACRLFDLVGIPDARHRLQLYPHELSGGQNQRVMIAMALAGEPELLIADEPTTSLDTTIQAQILDLLDRLRRELGMALVLISHDLNVVVDMCEHVVVMYAGSIVEKAPAAQIFARPSHPYTRGLIGAVPPLTGARQRLVAIPGHVPEPWNMPTGCAFAPRCPIAVDACSAARPAIVPTGPGQSAACIRPFETTRNAASP